MVGPRRTITKRTRSRRGDLLMIAIGLILIVAPTLVSLQSVEYITIQTSSPVVEGEVCSIDVRIKTGVGVSGTANLFIDEVFYQSIGGSAGSDGIMYFSTGWKAVGVGNHVLRVCYFEDGYPTQPVDKSAVITVTASEVPPPSNGEPDIPSNGEPPIIEEPFDFGSVVQIAGLGFVAFGGISYIIKRRRSK